MTSYVSQDDDKKTKQNKYSCLVCGVLLSSDAVSSLFSIKMDGYSISDEDKTKIKALFNVTDDDVKIQLATLKEWVLDNPHLHPEFQEEDFLNIMLLRSKFREDLSKKLIEKYVEYTRKYPEVFQNLGTFKVSEEIGITVPVPKLTPNFERVVILKLQPGNLAEKPFDIHQLGLIAITTSLLVYNNDYVDSVRCIFDLAEVTIWHAWSFNPMEVYKIGSIVKNMLRLRISGIEIINAPSIIPMLLGIAKTILPSKLFSKITVHNDLSSLHKNIPLESLPSDYGGEAESTHDLIEKWDHIIEVHQIFFEKVASFSQGNDNEENET